MKNKSRFILLAFLISLPPLLAGPQARLKEVTGAAGAIGDRKDSQNSPFPSYMNGPILGLVFDHIHGGLRPILGIAGASTLGDILELGISISRAWISPQQNYVLAEIKESREIVLFDLSGDPPARTSMAIMEPGPDLIALSPTGISAVLHHHARHSIQLITGLPSTPSLVAEIDISSFFESVNTIAVSDDAGAALLGVYEREIGSIHVVDAGGGSGPVSVIGQASGISFLSNTRDALIADRRNHEVLFIRDVTGTREKVTVVGREDGVLGPVAIALSDDKTRLFIASSESSLVSVFDFDSGVFVHLPCRRVPSGLHRLAGASVFRLTDFSENPLLLLDGGAKEPRVVFVPAAPKLNQD